MRPEEYRKVAAEKITRRASVTDLSRASRWSPWVLWRRDEFDGPGRSYMIWLAAKYGRLAVGALLRVHKITAREGDVPRCSKRTCIQPWPVATVRSIRAHPNESRGRKASGLPCAARVAHHDSGVARPESAAPRAAWVHGSPSAGPPMVACCDLLASAGFATDSTVGDCDHERAETPCHPCAAGLARRAGRGFGVRRVASRVRLRPRRNVPWPGSGGAAWDGSGTHSPILEWCLKIIE